MSLNLLEVVKNNFSSDFVKKAASFLGENENSVLKAISGIVPSVLAGLVSKATSSAKGAEAVLSSAKEASNGGLFNNLSGLLSNNNLLNNGGEQLNSLLGDNTGPVTVALANYAGIKASSINSLMSMATPAALNSIGKHATEHNLNAEGVINMLSSQKSIISNALPEGLSSIASMVGLSKVAGITSLVSSSARATVSDIDEYTDRKTGGIGWMLPLFLLVSAGLLAWWFLLGGKKGCTGSNIKVPDTTTVYTDTSFTGDFDIDGKTTTISTGKIDTVTGDFIYDLGKMLTIDLPNNGGKLEVGEHSTEAKLVAFLNDGTKLVDTIKGDWFEFTNVKFETGSSTITDESLVQLKNMVLIAKSYPTAQFKLGGYTDNTGDATKNVTLSQKRADVVLAKLKELGATDNSLAGAKGYGPEWPIGDNTTAEGRAMNRRVAVNVKAK